MNSREFIREASKAGPGLDGYAFQADVYCVDCGREAICWVAATVAPMLADTDAPEFRDTETVPQPIFFGESEIPQHCGNCGEYLYGGCEHGNEPETCEDCAEWSL